MRIPLRATAVLVALLTLSLTGCTAGAPPSTGTDHATVLPHVHAIVPAPDGDGFLLGTHDGVYTATSAGQLGTRVGRDNLDAMGLTAVGSDLIASGHPGTLTPTELGDQNLGIIRSRDGGDTWDPVAFTGEKDFHALAAGPDGTLYAQATGNNVVLASSDLGVSWTPTGGALLAFAIVIDATGRIIATTPDGPQVSTDRGVTFTPLPAAPSLYPIAASPDHQRHDLARRRNRAPLRTGDRHHRRRRHPRRRRQRTQPAALLQLTLNRKSPRLLTHTPATSPTHPRSDRRHPNGAREMPSAAPTPSPMPS